MEPYYRSVLATHLSERQRKNARFSLRSFAKQLEMSPGQLSGLMNGKKNLTTKQAVKIIEKLELTEQESFDLLRGLHPKLQSKNSKNPDFHVLADDEFRLISDWQHFAILSLGRIRNNEATPRWIADQLGIDVSMAHAALSRLERMGLIEIRDGSFRQTTKPLTTTTEIPSRAIRDYHQQNLKLASEKLESISIDAREFTSVTMAIHPRNLPKGKKMIREFAQKICDELETKQPSEVYTMAVQLFPLTKPGKNL